VARASARTESTSLASRSYRATKASLTFAAAMHRGRSVVGSTRSYPYTGTPITRPKPARKPRSSCSRLDAANNYRAKRTSSAARAPSPFIAPPRGDRSCGRGPGTASALSRAHRLSSNQQFLARRLPLPRRHDRRHVQRVVLRGHDRARSGSNGSATFVAPPIPATDAKSWSLTPLLYRRAREPHGDGTEVVAAPERYGVDNLLLLRDFVRRYRELNQRRAHRLAKRQPARSRRRARRSSANPR
jgi:hypothetical protein